MLLNLKSTNTILTSYLPNKPSGPKGSAILNKNGGLKHKIRTFLVYKQVSKRRNLIEAPMKRYIYHKFREYQSTFSRKSILKPKSVKFKDIWLNLPYVTNITDIYFSFHKSDWDKSIPQLLKNRHFLNTHSFINSKQIFLTVPLCKKKEVA